MSFYTSLTGLNSATSQLSVTSNNIANVGTTAFKRSRADFGDIFSTSPLQKASAQVGQGVLLKGVSQEFSQGNISTSGNSLDLAITGDGFFPLKTADGLQDIYTRNGAFMLNEQNNVVNGQGMKLQAASVDSSGTADLSNLSVLTIPAKTAGDALSTSQVQLGLNLPGEADVITEPFDRTDPSTYNDSTALTVYDDSGEGYLATVYYVKTQTANISNPESKWQTHFYIDQQKFEPRLQQVTNESGQYMQINKYGETRYINSPSSAKFPMYRYDDNRTAQASVPATLAAEHEPDAAYAVSANGDISMTAGQSISFNLSVDGSAAQAITYTAAAEDLTDGKIAATSLAKKLTAEISNVFGAADLAYGINVAVDNGAFSIASGTTGDTSSIALSGIDSDPGSTDLAHTMLGFANAEVKTTEEAVRGKPSSPAVLTTDAIQVNTEGKMVLNTATEFNVNFGSVSGTITLDARTTAVDPALIAEEIQTAINYSADNASNLESSSGQRVYGVTVEYDADNEKFVVTSPSTGGNSIIELTPLTNAEIFGLSSNTRAQGETSSWISRVQNQINKNDSYVVMGADGYPEEVTDPSDQAENVKWWPVYLDPGELTFGLDGQLTSPFTANPFTAAANGGGDNQVPIAAMTIDLTKSTQFGGSFSVLSQSQDGKPEGDLMGLDIGEDGLVSANFSNGAQKSLGKIVLANFASPTGLRQQGDASYLASSTSGAAKIGEAGSSGYGSIRAGAIERSNVDLTQELVDLITAQRNFQANAKAIETSNTLTQAIIQIRG